MLKIHTTFNHMYNTHLCLSSQTGGEEVGQFRVAVWNVQGIVTQSSKDLQEREGVVC